MIDIGRFSNSLSLAHLRETLQYQLSTTIEDGLIACEVGHERLRAIQIFHSKDLRIFMKATVSRLMLAKGQICTSVYESPGIRGKEVVSIFAGVHAPDSVIKPCKRKSSRQVREWITTEWSERSHTFDA